MIIVRSITPFYLSTMTDYCDFTGFDLRPFLYPSRFPWQFRKIDEVAQALPDRSLPGATGRAGIDKDKTE